MNIQIDLFDIGEEYKRKYQRPLDFDLHQTCSGDYLRLIATLLNGANNNNVLDGATKI